MHNTQKILPSAKARPAVIAMIHLGAMPGTPAYMNNDAALMERALREAEIYSRAGVDGILIENMHDTPYLRGTAGHEVTAMMAVIASSVRKAVNVPCGIQILAGANREALAVAKAAGLQFIRAEGFVFAHVADEGFIQSDAGELLRYRKQIDAEHIAIVADIKKKHSSHAITADVDLSETARAAEFFRADGVIVTGTATGSPADASDLEVVSRAVKVPVWVGSGVTAENVHLYKEADALIVGSYFKRNGRWDEEVEEGRVERLMRRIIEC